MIAMYEVCMVFSYSYICQKIIGKKK
uniref:BLTX309 n=1 Tax=Nephila pilipes TaxID=299642 RepID=A0A076KZC0_NEPPI|nr:BLTX309 [Nephila pilipes]